MSRPGELIHGSLIFFFIIGLVASASSSSQSDTKKALKTIGRFFRSKTGTEWLAGLAQTKSGPLTTAELMDRLIKSSKSDGKIFKSAKTLRKALETKKKKGDLDGPDAWDDLIKNIEEQDDIICLYRKDSDTSMRKADDWKKFLKSVSSGYTVHLALDKGKKYVICLKKINISELEKEKSLETTNIPKETTESTQETEKLINQETTTEMIETTDQNEIDESEEESGHEEKFTETRKSRFGPSYDDIKYTEADDVSESEDCSEEADSDEYDSKANENKPECNRQIIVMMPNPYGTTGSPWIYSTYQIPKGFPQIPPNINYPWNVWNWRNPLTNKDSFDPKLSYYHPGYYGNKWFQNSKNPDYNLRSYKHHRPHHGQNSHKQHKQPFVFKPVGKSLERNLKQSPNFYQWKKPSNYQYPKFDSGFGQNQYVNPNFPFFNSMSNFGARPENFGWNQKWPLFFNRPNDPSNNVNKYPQFFQRLPQGQRCQMNQFWKPFMTNRGILENQGSRVNIPGAIPWNNGQFFPDQMRLVNNQFTYPVNQQKYPNQQISSTYNQRIPNYQMIYPNYQPNPNNLQQFPENQLNSPDRLPKIQQFPGYQPLFPNNQLIYPNYQRNNNPQVSGDNRFSKMQQIFPGYQSFPNYQMIYQQRPNNQQVLPENQIISPDNRLPKIQQFPNNQMTYPINQKFPYPVNFPNQPKFPLNLKSSLTNTDSLKCPSLCDKPIELRIRIEGNVDKPVKIGVLSQPGTWVNIVDNQENSRRMLKANEETEEDENVEEESKETENFEDELIHKSDKKIEKNLETKNESSKINNEEKEKQEEKEKEIEPRILPDITTAPDLKSTDLPTVSAPAT